MADRLGPLNPAAFSGGTDIVVTPRAVAQFSDAVRQGIITAEDIRARELQAKAAQAELTPEMIQARQTQAVANAKLADLQVKAAEKLASYSQNGQRMLKELMDSGVNIGPNPTEEDIIKKWNGLEQWKLEVATAKAYKDRIKEREFKQTTGAGEVTSVADVDVSTQTILPSGKGSPRNSVDLFLTQFGASPNQWLAAGQPKVADVFGERGQVATPAAPAPAAAPAAPAPAAPAGTPPAPAVTPTAALPAPGTKTAQGLVISSSPGTAGKTTETGAKMAIALSRMQEGDKVFEEMKAKGYNPSELGQWFQNYFVGPLQALKTGDKRTWDAASSLWIQGLLRLESGAAISQKEQSWYEQTFFPQPGEGKAVHESKERARKAMEAAVSELARSNGINTEAYYQTRDAAGNSVTTSVLQDALSTPGVPFSDGYTYRRAVINGQEVVLKEPTKTGKPVKSPDKLPPLPGNELKVTPKKRPSGAQL